MDISLNSSNSTQDRLNVQILFELHAIRVRCNAHVLPTKNKQRFPSLATHILPSLEAEVE